MADINLRIDLATETIDAKASAEADKLLASIAGAPFTPTMVRSLLRAAYFAGRCDVARERADEAEAKYQKLVSEQEEERANAAILR